MKLSRLLSFATPIALAGWVACSNGGGTGPAQCRTGADCSGGEVCLDGNCSRLCTSSAGCPSGQVCLNDVCVEEAAVTLAPPVIESIDGNGAVVPTPTDTPDGQGGTPTRHRYHTALSIHGRNLRDPVQVAIDAVDLPAPLPLEVRSSSEKIIVASLPWQGGDELPGRYTLSVTNAQGTAGVEVWILRGADGSTPTPTEIRNIVLSIPDIHAGAAWGRFYEAEGAPMATTVSTGTNVEDTTGSGGWIRQATDLATAGELYAFQSDTIGEPIAISDSKVLFRLKVSSNVLNADIAKLRCAALTTGQTSMVILDQVFLKPDAFVAPDQWQIFTLNCPFAPADANQRVAIEEFVTGLATLSVDYVRVVPTEVCCTP